MPLGDFVKKRREELGLTKAALARLSNLHPTHIGKIEKNSYKTTSRDTIDALSKALQSPTMDFYRAAGIIEGITYDVPAKSLHDMSIREITMGYLEVPVIADMHAPGHPIEYIYLPRTGSSHKNLYGVKIQGDCLAPKANDGDIIIIDKDDHDYIGKSVLCYHNGASRPQIIKYKKPRDIESCEDYGVILWIMKKP